MNKHRKNKYKRAFQVACALLNGDNIYGVECSDFNDIIYQDAMEKDGFCCSKSYEKYILRNLERLSK